MPLLRSLLRRLRSLVRKEQVDRELDEEVGAYPARSAIVFIPIYPNNLPTVPKPSRVSRTASLVFSNLPASLSAITRSLNRFRE
jgi:hypothetical protein